MRATERGLVRAAVDQAEMNLAQRRDWERLAPSLEASRLERERAEERLAEAEAQLIYYERALSAQLESWRSQAARSSIPSGLQSVSRPSCSCRPAHWAKVGLRSK